MKKVIFLITAVVAMISTGCDIHDDWGDGLPEYEHVYYVGFYKTGTYLDYLTYEITQNGSARWRYAANATSGTWITVDEQWVVTIPMRLYSERVRNYDAVTYFWVYNLGESALTAGVDYTVSLENGTVLTPNPNGAYSLTWPQTKKGIQNVRIKRSESSSNGTLRVNFFDPSKDAPSEQDPLTAIQNKTAEYEIRCITADNNRVTVNFTN